VIRHHDEQAESPPGNCKGGPHRKGEPMAVMDYRAQDGLADYGGSIEFRLDIGWRVCTIFEPFHQGHDESLESAYQSIDGDGRRYVDWSPKLDNLGEEKTVVRLWSESRRTDLIA
jgi:hypothetical protein